MSRRRSSGDDINRALLRAARGHKINVGATTGPPDPATGGSTPSSDAGVTGGSSSKARRVGLDEILRAAKYGGDPERFLEG